jgi:hypothetical protein
VRATGARRLALRRRCSGQCLLLHASELGGGVLEEEAEHGNLEEELLGRPSNMPPRAAFPALWSLVVAYSRRKASTATSRRRSSSVTHQPCRLASAHFPRTSPPRTSLAPHLRALPSRLTSAPFRASLCRFIGEKGERRRRPWRRRKGGASSAGRHEREEACSEREESRSENGCRRHVLHLYVA